MNYSTESKEMPSWVGSDPASPVEQATKSERAAGEREQSGLDKADHADRLFREIWGEHLHHGLWRTRRDTPEEATRTLVDIVAARAQLAPGMDVTDIGCGYGATARLLAKERDVRVTGITVSPAQFCYADAQLVEEDKTHLRFMLGDWLANELPDASQDALIAIESTERMADKARAFREACRVLKPGGRLIVCAWTAASETEPWQRRHLLDPIRRGRGLAGFDREHDHVRWMTEAGLSVTARDDVTKRVSRTWSVCLRRLLWRWITRPRQTAEVLKKPGERGFAASVPRLWLAYRTGALRYVVYCACRPPLE